MSDLGDVATAPEQRELTVRAVAAGCALGVVLAVANVYTGLKTGFMDGGNITASVLAFAFFRGSRQRYSALENNLTQTIAASAAVMSMVVGVVGPVPALALLGHTAPTGLLVLWGLGLGTLGVAVAIVLRPQLIADEGLPFPTGTATAEVILALAESASSALRRARILLLAALAAGVIGWLRDSPLGLVPQEWLLPGLILGVPLSSLSVGVAVSPLLLSTGLLIGLGAAGGMLLGSLIGWVVIAPQLLSHGVVARAEHGLLLEWLMWPGAALMLSSSLTSLLLEWRSLVRGFVDLRALADGQRARSGTRSPLYAVLLLSIACALMVTLVARAAFGLSIGTSLLALLLSLVLSSACARSAGETDVAPVGAMGAVSQLLLGGSGSIASLATGAVVSGVATQTAQSLWAFKSGDRLGASLKAQIVGPLIGVGVGALVVVPVYEVVARVYGIGSEKMPAPSVMSWKATAEAVQGGLAALPAHAPLAILLACLLGVVATLLSSTRFARFIPSPVALGLGILTPVSLSASVFVGALLLLVLKKRYPSWAEENVTSLAGGAIAGESLFAVVLAALIAAGVVS